MTIREDLVIDFKLPRYLQRKVDVMYQLYEYGQRFDEKSEKFKKIDAKFFEIMNGFEVDIAMSCRAGDITERQMNILYFKFND